uniref:Exosome complex component RRP43 n=1 Tax=Lygus hesperus TaxID=30085 RepID=A0A0A9WIA8_LYGHE
MLPSSPSSPSSSDLVTSEYVGCSSSNNSNNINELILIVDPTTEEAAAAATLLTIAVTAEGQVCAIEKREGSGVSLAVIEKCIGMAIALAPSMLTAMQTAMIEHEQGRERLIKSQFL